MANKTYTEVLDTMIPWADIRDDFQQETRYGEHRAICGLAGKFMVMPDPIKYVNVSTEYVPVDECASRNLPSSGNQQTAIQFSLNIIASILTFSAVMLWN